MSRAPVRRGKADEGGEASPPDGDVNLGVLADYIGFHLRSAQDAFFRAFARHTGKPHLKSGRFSALMVISNNPGISQVTLARAISRDKSTVTPLIQDLDRHGLIVRRRSRSDRRTIRLELTPAGQAQLADLFAVADDYERRLDRIAGGEKPALIALLKKIAATLAARNGG